MITHSASPAGTGPHALLTALAPAVRRVRIRRLVSAAAWLTGASCALVGMHLLLVGARAPHAVLLAMRPMLLLAAFAVVASFVWTLARRVDPSVVAGELDVRAGLRDEIKTAWWFASQPGHTAWKALLLHRAVDTLGTITPATVVPVRPARGLVLASGLGLLVLVAGLIATSSTTRHSGYDAGTGPGAEARLSMPGRNTRASEVEAMPVSDGASPAEAAGAPPSADTKSSGRNAADAPSSGGPAKPGTPPGVEPPPPPPGTGASGTASAPASAVGVVSGGSIARAPDLSLEVANGVLQRLQSALGLGGSENERAELGHELTAPLAGGQADTAPRNSPEKENTTLDAFTEALRGLSKTPDGDQPMLNAGTPGGSRQGGGKTTLTGGASGMRVNLSDPGDGGMDTPPDAPLSEPQSVQGPKTERLAVQLNRVSTGPADRQNAGENEGFYAASQAQAARVEASAGVAAVRGSTEAARIDERVPLAYRNVVKRYFVNEHGKRP